MINEGLLTWTCRVCGQQRPDAKISVYTQDTSLVFGFTEEGMMQQNVNYCNDNKYCQQHAPDQVRLPSD
jgi:hypothetical protein